MKDEDLLDQKKVGDFWDKIYKMADKEFGLDCDGDSRVQIIVVDRTRYYSDHFRKIPYEHKAATLEELKKIMEARMANLKLAMESFQTHLDTREYEERRINAEEKSKAKEGGK